MSTKTKGIDHIDESRNDEIIALTLSGALIGGFRHKYGYYESFDPFGVFIGAATFALSGCMATAPEALAGLFIYNVEGAFLATVASSSYEAALLTLISSPSYNYQIMLVSASVGTVIHVIKNSFCGYQDFIKDSGKFSYLLVNKFEASELAGNITDNQLEAV